MYIQEVTDLSIENINQTARQIIAALNDVNDRLSRQISELEQRVKSLEESQNGKS